MVIGATTAEWVCKKRRKAAAVTGSEGLPAGVCGATSRVASGWAPMPTRTRQKSGSAVRRSHIRGPPINVHSVSGSG